MAEKTILEKLTVKPGRSFILVNPPPGYTGHMGSLPEGARWITAPGEPADVIQVFVETRAALESQLARLKTQLKPGGALWVTYYKGTARVKTDINRDSINAYGKTLGLIGVAMISIDDDWSALRFKAVEVTDE